MPGLASITSSRIAAMSAPDTPPYSGTRGRSQSRILASARPMTRSTLHRVLSRSKVTSRITIRFRHRPRMPTPCAARADAQRRRPSPDAGSRDACRSAWSRCRHDPRVPAPRAKSPLDSSRWLAKLCRSRWGWTPSFPIVLTAIFFSRNWTLRGDMRASPRPVNRRIATARRASFGKPGANRLGSRLPRGHHPGLPTLARDGDKPVGKVEIADVDGHEFGKTQPAAVEQLQHRTVTDVDGRHGAFAEQLRRLVGIHGLRQTFVLLRRSYTPSRIGTDFVAPDQVVEQATHARQMAGDRARRQPPGVQPARECLDVMPPDNRA